MPVVTTDTGVKYFSTPEPVRVSSLSEFVAAIEKIQRHVSSVNEASGDAKTLFSEG